MSEMENVYLNSNDHARAVIEVESRDARFVRETQRQWPLHQYRRLAQLMRTIRLVKSVAASSVHATSAGVASNLDIDGEAHVMARQQRTRLDRMLSRT